MKATKKSYSRARPLPRKHSTVQLDRLFSAEEIQKIQLGLIPRAQEDKWFVYWEKDALYFHRSWTGYCLYVIRFAAEGNSMRMVSAEVNRNPKQYKETNDQQDIAMISYLIDVLLLHQDSEFPSDERSPEMQAVQYWSQVGRAMFGDGE